MPAKSQASKTTSPRKPGRPSKLTPELQRRLCTLLRRGMPRERAARLAGISASTFHAWMAEGATAEPGPFLEFSEAVQKAEDMCFRRAIFTVDDLMGPKYEPSTRLKAATTILKGRFASDFATRQEVTGAGGGPVQVQAAVAVAPLVSDEQLRTMSTEQLAALVSGLVGPASSPE